jgi:hypothetical protein
MPESGVLIHDFSRLCVSVLTLFIHSENCEQQSVRLSTLGRYGADHIMAQALTQFYSEWDNCAALLDVQSVIKQVERHQTRRT